MKPLSSGKQDNGFGIATGVTWHIWSAIDGNRTGRKLKLNTQS